MTGATRGIGRAIAEELASKGAFVIGTATSEKGADTISAYLCLLYTSQMCCLFIFCVMLSK